MGNVTELNMPKLREVGNICFMHFDKLQNLELLSLKRVGNECFRYLRNIKKINLPELIIAGHYVLEAIMNPYEINMPNIEQFGNNCLSKVYTNLHELSMPKLKKAGDNFLKTSCLEKLDFPMLEQVGDNFLDLNRIGTDIALSELRLPNLKKAGNMCLGVISNLDMESVDLSNLEQVGIKQSKYNEEMLSTIIANNMERMSELQKGITPRNIAELDIDNKITTTEINLVQLFLEKVKKIFKKKDNYER